MKKVLQQLPLQQDELNPNSRQEYRSQPIPGTFATVPLTFADEVSLILYEHGDLKLPSLSMYQENPVEIFPSLCNY